MAKEQKNMPIGNAREGSISLAIFDGIYGKNAVLQKSYLPKEVRDKLGKDEKAKDDDWKRSSVNLFLNELPNVKKVVDQICKQFADEIEASSKKD